MTTELERLRAAIKNSQHAIKNLGEPETAPTSEMIDNYQRRIGYRFPSEFILFLTTYGGAEIFGDEIFSMYGPDHEDMPSGDLVYQYNWHQNNKVLKAGQIPFLRTGTGEVFYFDTNENSTQGLVYCLLGDETINYASDFIQFLSKYTR